MGTADTLKRGSDEGQTLVLERLRLSLALIIHKKFGLKTTPISTKPGHYRPDDDLLAFLKGL